MTQGAKLLWSVVVWPHGGAWSQQKLKYPCSSIQIPQIYMRDYSYFFNQPGSITYLFIISSRIRLNLTENISHFCTFISLMRVTGSVCFKLFKMSY